MSASKRATPKAIPAAAATAISPATRRAFRWVAALVLPLSLLMAAELVLRAAGWHYPTHFFIPAGSDSSDGCRENPKFGWRFFPRRLARAPDPVRIVRTKGPGTVRIMVFGESAALGDPVPAYGFSRILRELLEERCVDVKFEVVNVSVTAINSHAILQIAQDCVPFQADVWIIYMGNNEVVGPFGAGSVFGLKAPPLWVIRASLMAKRTCLGQLVDEWWQRASVRQQAFHEWEGMKMMVKEVVRRDDPSLARVYQHFRENLEDILAMGRRAGVKTLLCSMSANLKDCPPFASLNGGICRQIKNQNGIASPPPGRRLRTGGRLGQHWRPTAKPLRSTLLLAS